MSFQFDDTGLLTACICTLPPSKNLRQIFIYTTTMWVKFKVTILCLTWGDLLQRNLKKKRKVTVCYLMSVSVYTRHSLKPSTDNGKRGKVVALWWRWCEGDMVVVATHMNLKHRHHKHYHLVVVVHEQTITHTKTHKPHWNPPPFLHTHKCLFDLIPRRLVYFGLWVWMHTHCMLVAQCNPRVDSPSCQRLICLHYHHMARKQICSGSLQQ